jgi:hypothetical protein
MTFYRQAERTLSEHDERNADDEPNPRSRHAGAY